MITRVTASALAQSPIRDTLTRGFSDFVASLTVPVASGWSVFRGGTCTYWKAPPCWLPILTRRSNASAPA
jgi:hypothetical protein